jgi:hypothetical protein
VSSERRARTDEIYRAIETLRSNLGGPRRLSEVTARSGWPSHGVYLFFEEGEVREDGVTPRVTRVGTHALTVTSKTTLWNRLSQHRGSVGGVNPGGGNHRGSVFRLHVGTALIARDGWPEAAETWGKGSSPGADVRSRERALERAVSEVIGAMPVLWLDVPDREARGLIERDLIGLLSSVDRDPIDPPSSEWLGRFADRPAIRRSGLWNVNHVADEPTGAGLALFAQHVARATRG